MKFTFDKDSLLKEIAIAQEIIATKNALSILSNVLLIADEGSLTIKATDIKVNFTTKISVDIKESGSTTILCDKFLSILGSLPSGNIDFQQSDIKITITPVSKKAKFQLKSIASDTYPEFNSVSNINYFDFPAKEFKEMIHQTVFSISDDETRYFMNGVFFEKGEDSLNMIATDGRRLAFASKAFSTAVDFKPAIIPQKVLNIINKRASDEGPISIAVTEKTIFFKFGNYEFSSLLIEGQFPNYRRVIPETHTHTCEVEKSELMEALKRVSLLVEQKSRRIYLTLTPGTLIISSQETEIGTAKEEIPCQYDDEEIMIALNYIYLEEPLKVCNTSRIIFEFTESMKAIKMRTEPVQDFFHIIMPMQVE